MINAIRRNPIISAITGVALIAAAILLYQFDFFSNGLDGIRNKRDCRKVKSKKSTYTEKVAACRALFARDSINAINDDPCTNICQQILECEQARGSNSITELKRFLEKYENAPKVDCYQQALTQLDNLRCDEAMDAPDTVRMLAMQQYLDEFGENGACFDEIRAALDECDAIIASDSCVLFYDYLNTIGEEGACYYDVHKKYYEVCVNGPKAYYSAKADSLAYQEAKTRGDCDAYRKYLMLQPRGEHRQEFLEIMKEQCPEDLPSTFQFAAPVMPQEADAIGGRIKGGAPSSYDSSSARKRTTATCKTYTVDGQSFQAIKIGPLLVMCDNLNVPMYNSICYNYDARNCQEYGELYTYPEAMAACPRGWRLPCESEVDFLISTYYSNPQRAFENISHHARIKFGGIAAGNTFMNLGQEAYFWCATEASDTDAYYYKFDNWNKTVLNGDVMDKTYRMSCRCVSVADEREYQASRISRIRCHNQPN